MEMKLDEQLLVTDFRKLDPAGKKELLDYAVFLVRKQRTAPVDESPAAGNQCGLEPKEEERPEAVKEPIFTE